MGQVEGVSSTLEKVWDGLWTQRLVLSQAKQWRLDTGAYFMQGATMKAVSQSADGIRRSEGGGQSNGVKSSIRGTSENVSKPFILEARGVLIGKWSPKALEAMLNSISWLQSIIMMGLASSNPSVVLEVDMPEDLRHQP